MLKKTNTITYLGKSNIDYAQTSTDDNILLSSNLITKKKYF